MSGNSVDQAVAAREIRGIPTTGASGAPEATAKAARVKGGRRETRSRDLRTRSQVVHAASGLPYSRHVRAFAPSADDAYTYGLADRLLGSSRDRQGGGELLITAHSSAAMCGALGAAQPDESVADPVDLRCRLRHLQGYGKRGSSGSEDSDPLCRRSRRRRGYVEECPVPRAAARRKPCSPRHARSLKSETTAGRYSWSP